MNITKDVKIARKPQQASLKKNFLWTFIGNLVNAGSQWALVVILAKRTTPEMVGQFAFALAITTPIMLFASLKLRSAQATDQRDEYRFDEYWSLRLLTTVLAVIAVLVLGFVIGTNHDAVLVIALVGAAKGIESLSDVLYGLFQKKERMDLISYSMIIRGVLTIFLAGAVLSVTTSVVALAGCLLFSWTITLFLCDIPNARRQFVSDVDSFRLIPNWSNPRLKKLVLLTFPLGASLTVGALYNNTPRYFIENLLGSAELGIFSALAYFMLFGGMVFTALAQSVIPRLARFYAEGNLGGFRHILYRLISLGFCLGLSGIIVAFFFGDYFIQLFYTVEYVQYRQILVLFMIASFLDYPFLAIASAINAMRFFRVQVVVSTISALIMIPLCFVLVNNLGLEGAALSMVAVKSIEALIYIFIYRRLIKGAYLGSENND